MRYQPAHAATDPVPFVLRAPRSLRLALSAAVAATIGFVPVAFVASPAQAAAGDVDFDADIEAGEGDSFTFELRRQGGSADAMNLTYSTIDGTAVAGEDYTAIPFTSITIPASTRDVVKRITVAGVQDALDENNETFGLRVTGTVNGVPITPVVAEGILDDDDATPSYSLTVPDPVAEGAGNARVTATLSARSGRDVVIPISTGDGTAVAPGDYTATSANLTVPKGETTGYLNVPIIDDVRDEEDAETFTVTGATGGGGELNSGGVKTVAIGDDDVMPTVDVADAGTATEGSPLDFTVSLSAPSDRTVTVVADTVDGSAVAGADYDPVASQTVTFLPGESSRTVTVATRPDPFDEETPETLSLRLGSPSNATAGDLTGAGSVTDDDDPPVVSLIPSSVAEGDTGELARTFTVVLDAPSGREVRIGYQVNAGTAVAGQDFAPVTPGELVFAPGETSKTFEVKLLGDRIDETDETFSVVLANAAATVTGALGPNTVTIDDDDATPAIATLTAFDVNEGGASATRTARVELTNPSAQPITLDVSVADDTADAGGSGPGSDDFDLLSPTVTVPAGAIGADIPIVVNGDAVHEDDETADLTVATAALDPNVASGAETATLTLRNDDAVPTVVLNAGSGAEGDTVDVTATVTGVSQDPIPVSVTATGAANAGSDPAQPADFDATGLTGNAIPGGTIAGPVPLGSIVLTDDAIDEVDQTVGVALTGIGTVAPRFVTVTDDVDDMPPTVTPGPATAAETDGDVDVPVTLDFSVGGNTATATERTISARWATADGTAKQPADYVAGTGTVTFTPGDTSETVTVDIADDQIFERDETFTVALSDASPVATPLAAASAVTITDDDSANKPAFEVGAPATAFREGSAGTADFTVQLDRVTAEDVTFDVVLDGGTATTGVTTPGGDDFATPVATVTVPAGRSSATVPVTVRNDDVFERDETATLRVTRTSGENDAVGGEETATLSIVDDDPMPTVVVNTAPAEEGAATVAVTGTVTGVTQDDIAVTVTAAGAARDGGDAAENTDFDAAGLGATVIPGGLIAGPVPLGTLALADDRADENDETVRVTVSGLAADVSGWQTVTDDPDDMPPAVSVGDVTAGEAGGPAELPVTLDFGLPGNDATSTEKTVTVRYATADGTARAPGDYTAGTATVTFAPGADERVIEVPVTDDGVFERTEAFAVNLSAPVAATIADGAATVTVADDDSAAKPALQGVADVTFTEGSAPAATFTVQLDKVTAEPVTVDVAMAAGTATTGLAGVGGNDFTPPAATVTVQPGARSAAVTVPVTDDTVFERPEEATITVGLAAGEDDAIGAGDTATLRITDDEAAPRVVLNAVGGSEGTDITVVATVTGAAQEELRLGGYAEGYGAGGLDPAEDSDFTDNGLGASVPAGTPSGTYRMGTVTLNQDDIDEFVETVRVTVGDENGLGAIGTALYRISDDPNDLPPSVSVGDETIGEGEGSVDVTVRLTFDGDTQATEQVITVPWSTVDGSARSGVDYTARSGSVTFEPGRTEATVSIPVRQDQLFENGQTFAVRLGTPTPRGVEVTKASGSVTILDDDPAKAPTLTAPATRNGAGPVTLSGFASEGTLVRLYAAPVSAPNAFTLVATATAGVDGAYSFTRNLDRGHYFHTRANNLDSERKLVRAYQVPALAVSSGTRGTVSLTVTSNPALLGQAVTIQRQNANGTWSTVARGTTGGSTRSYAATLRNLRSGTAMTFRAYITADAQQGTLGGYSASRRITVR